MKLSAYSILLLTYACALAQTTQPSIDDALLSKLTELDSKAASITDLTAHYEQQKFTPLLKKPITSSGTISATRNIMLWNTEKPEPTRMRIDEKSLKLYYVNQNILEEYPITDKFGSLAANPLPRLKMLIEQFHISRVNEQNNLVIRLKPRDAKLAENLEQVDVEIDQETGVVRRFEMVDPDGERTVIEFKDYRLNVGLNEKDLDLQVAKGAKVVKPLERSP